MTMLKDAMNKLETEITAEEETILERIRYAECGGLGIARFGACNQLYVGSLQALPVG